MKTKALVVGFASLALSLAACGGEKTGEGDPEGSGGASNGHEDHDHDGHGHGHAHEGEEHALGSTTIGSRKVSVTQIGEIETGKEVVFDIAVGGTPSPTLRVWFGDSAGKVMGAKSKVTSANGDYDVHMMVPAGVRERTKFWVEVEDQGSTNKKSFDLELDDHDHDDHDDHDH